MPKVKKDTGATVSGKDYLREIPGGAIERALNNNSDLTPILYLYGAEACGYSSPFKQVEDFAYIVHGCPEGNGKPQKIKGEVYVNDICKYCGKKLSSSYHQPRISTNEYKNSAMYSRSYSESLKLNDLVYISQKEGEDDTTLIRLVTSSISYEKDRKKPGEYLIKTVSDVKSAIEVIPGVSVKGYRVLKRSIKESSAFEAMNINTQTINSKWTRDFAYEDSLCFEDFLHKHKIFSERTGIRAALKCYPSDMNHINNDPFMLLHLCMISEYPVLEALVKIGYTKLYFDLVRSFYNAQSKVEILQTVKFYQQLFNVTSKGSMGLRIPTYIGEYLKSKGAPIQEYLLWCNIYELQPMSNEQFNKYIETIEYIPILSSRALSVMPNIIKYGYTIEQATKYIFKQFLFLQKKGEKNKDCIYLAKYMHDYLTMCEFLEITPNKFPPNLIQSHDEVAKLKKSSISVAAANKIKSIGQSTQALLDSFVDPDKLTKMEEKYFIKVPVTEADFIEEGNLQNNCVGNYHKRVSNGNCIVFFVRKKDEPGSSFITAEYDCHTERLGQCMFANNRVVEDEDLLNYCKVACSRIKTGILTAKIA